VGRLFFLALLVTGLVGMTLPALAQRGGELVLVVPIHGTIDGGMAHLVQRSIAEAQAQHVKAIVLDVNTFGGLVSAGTEIRDAIFASPIPVYAYVSERAWSAGALVTLAAEKIVMAPGSSIGAAEPIPKSVKTVSALRAEFESTARRYHRNTQIAGGMVDATLDAPPYKNAGAILSLTADDALSAHFVDAVEPSRGAAFAYLGLRGAHIIEGEYTFGEKIARFATDTQISGLLITLGFLGLLLEMQTLHGIAGTIGVGALALFFGAHVYAGFSNGLVIGLALLGIVGILFELHVLPGHGLAGGLGVVALLSAIVLAFGIPFFFVAVQSVAVAIVLTAIFFTLATRFIPESAFMRRIVFVGVQGPEYVASASHVNLIGQTGFASSFLRPAGVATIGGERIDVLTEGEFVSAGSAVRVTRVEGARIFVRSIDALERMGKET